MERRKSRRKEPRNVESCRRFLSLLGVFFISSSPLRLSVSARDTILCHRSELAIQPQAAIPRGSHTKPQRRKEELKGRLPTFVALWLRVRTSSASCHGSRSIRRSRRSPDNHQPAITNHQRQGSVFSRNQERLPLCRVPAERRATRGDPLPIPLQDATSLVLRGKRNIAGRYINQIDAMALQRQENQFYLGPAVAELLLLAATRTIPWTPWTREYQAIPPTCRCTCR